MRQLIVDPEFQKQIPPLTSEELDQLEKNILHEGQVLDPIIVWNDIILDGHNRYQIVQGHPEIKFDVKSLEFEDRNQAQIWICLHQLGRRNLTHEQKKYLMGMRYEIEKASHGASNGFRGNSHTKDLVSYQNGNLLKTERTCDRIAKELNVGRSTVIRANEFAKGLTAAEEVSPGILQEVLSGSVKATQDEVSALARASPDTRKELVEKIRHPPTKEKKVTGKPAVTPPQPDSRPIELSPAQKCADALNELTDAVEMYVFRWDRCFSIYKDIFNTDEMQVEARKLIDQMQKYVNEKLEELNEHKRNL